MRAIVSMLDELPLPLRWSVELAAAMFVIGAVVGLIIGLQTYIPTAWFAMIEIGVPAAMLGAILGALGGAVVSLSRRITR